MKRALLPTLILLAAAPAAANDYHWTNASGGSFATPGNWSPTGPPQPGDHAFLDKDGTYTVTVGASASVASVAVGTSTATVMLSIASGKTLTITGDGNTLYAGSSVSNAG